MIDDDDVLNLFGTVDFAGKRARLGKTLPPTCLIILVTHHNVQYTKWQTDRQVTTIKGRIG